MVFHRPMPDFNRQLPMRIVRLRLCLAFVLGILCLSFVAPTFGASPASAGAYFIPGMGMQMRSANPGVAQQKPYLDPQAATGDQFVDRQAAMQSMQSMGGMQPNAVSVATLGNPDSPAVLRAQPSSTGGAYGRMPNLPQAITLRGRTGTYAVNAVHSVTGPGGKILLIMGSGNDANTFAAGTFAAFMWSPTAGIYKSLIIPQDMFCSGHLLMSNGLALAAGGTKQYGKPATATSPALPWLGEKALYFFDFKTETFRRGHDLVHGRWYPTLTKQPDAKVLITGGIDENGANPATSETFDEHTGMSALTTGPQTTPFALYPNIFYVRGSGTGKQFFYTNVGTGGSHHSPGIWMPYQGGSTGRFVAVSGLRQANARGAATSCWIGDVRSHKLLVMGGNPPTNYVDLIDINAATPKYVPAPPLPSAIFYVSCVELPNGAVVEIGGGNANLIVNASRAVAILPSTTSPKWLVQNPFPAATGVNNSRLYHSSEYLLNDGTIVSYGSNPGPSSTPLPPGETLRSYSVYKFAPMYLYAKGNRPMFSAAPPSSVRYGSTVTLRISGGDVKYLTVQAMPLATHDQDVNVRQVMVPVAKTSTPGVYTAKLSFTRYDIMPGPVRFWAVSSTGKWGTAAGTVLSIS